MLRNGLRKLFGPSKIHPQTLFVRTFAVVTIMRSLSRGRTTYKKRYKTSDFEHMAPDGRTVGVY